jgi:ABC-2 type transport system ATP-binding protein
LSGAIKTVALCKSYRRRRRSMGFAGTLRSFFSTTDEEVPAVSGISFEVQRGEAVGVIGENGAGKSTTLKLLMGILVPTSGSVTSLGLCPYKERRRLAMNIGVVFGQRPQLLWDIPAGESFKLMRDLYQVPDSIYRYTYTEAVERLGLGPLLRSPVRTLSLGQRMRCDLALSLLHAPALVFLDEPTIGLDVAVKERVREFLTEMRRRFGTTIILTTHDLKDIKATCERLLVLDHGKLLFDGDLKKFESRFATARSMHIELERDVAVETALAFEREMASYGASVAWEPPKRIKVNGLRPADSARIAAAALRCLPVQDFAVHGTDLDALVTGLYRGGSLS